MHGIARFATFELNLRTGELRNRGIRLRLRRQSAEILGMLIERLGEVVARDEIRDKLWPGGTIVEFDHSVNSAVNRLRDVLGDSPSAPRFVETLPRVGYRFVGAVEIELPARGEPAPAAATARVEPLAVPSPERRLSRKTWTGAALLATGILLAAAMIAARHRLAPSSSRERPVHDPIRGGAAPNESSQQPR